MTRFFSLLIVAGALMALSIAPAAAQPAPKPEDLKASVPALDAMHDVIMPLWHDAWPNKDVKAMAAMLPDIEKHFAAVNKAQLPLILRDKQAAWVAGVDDLKQAVGAYKAAVAAGDNDALLKAAEKLHAQYEALVKIVRPILKEMEDFHASLYVLYHYQMSPFQLAKASESIRAMQVKMDALNKAALPERLKAKTEAFNTQRARLSQSIDELVALLDSKDESKIKAAIELMHAQYESLEKVF
jgi:NADH dehydrogenase/NADH:ubiquinone oxidoreductase subunit G